MTKSNLEGNCLPSSYSSGGDYSPLWWGRHSISSEGWQSVVVGQTRSLEWGMAVHCGGRGMVAGVWGLKGCQETERAYSSTYRKPKERTGSRTMLGNLKPYHQWHTASNKTSIPKDFRTLWNGTIYCIWTHEPVGNIYHLNYKDLGQTMLNPTTIHSSWTWSNLYPQSLTQCLGHGSSQFRLTCYKTMGLLQWTQESMMGWISLSFLSISIYIHYIICIYS